MQTNNERTNSYLGFRTYNQPIETADFSERLD